MEKHERLWWEEEQDPNKEKEHAKRYEEDPNEEQEQEQGYAVE